MGSPPMLEEGEHACEMPLVYIFNRAYYFEVYSQSLRQLDRLQGGGLRRGGVQHDSGTELNRSSLVSA